MRSGMGPCGLLVALGTMSQIAGNWGGLCLLGGFPTLKNHGIWLFCTGPSKHRRLFLRGQEDAGGDELGGAEQERRAGGTARHGVPQAAGGFLGGAPMGPPRAKPPAFPQHVGHPISQSTPCRGGCRGHPSPHPPPQQPRGQSRAPQPRVARPILTPII